MRNDCYILKDQIMRKMLSQFGEISEAHIEMLQKLDKFRIALEKAKEHHLQQWNLSEGRFMVLNAIWNCGGPIKASEIAQQLNVTKATMTGLVDSLMNSGYIEKFDCPEDRRAAFIKLSAKGEEFLKSILPEHIRCMKEFTEKLSQSEAANFSALLDKLYVGIEAFDTPE